MTQDLMGASQAVCFHFCILGTCTSSRVSLTRDLLNLYAVTMPRTYICSTPWESHTLFPLASVLSYPRLKRLPLPPRPVLPASQILPALQSPQRRALETRALSGSRNVKAGSRSSISRASAMTASTPSSPNCTPSVPGSKKRASREAACWFTAALGCRGVRR